MTSDLTAFAARQRDLISHPQPAITDPQFFALALELFALQFASNLAYQKICVARRLTPETLTDWKQIPAVPTTAFKEFEMTSLAPAVRTAVFHSSGTTEQKPSRHFHCAESLVLYDTSLWAAFAQNFQLSTFSFQLLVLTPPPAAAPHSSLVHMFETVRQKIGAPESAFLGHLAADGSWAFDFAATLAVVGDNSKLKTQNSKLILGTAFSFVHLLDFLAEENLRLLLPPGSLVMETGGYKNRSRTLPKAELHALITKYFGVPRENIICEYGMSELSSQAYDSLCLAPDALRLFRFPPWARVQIISPETGREVADGETGLVRVFDLTNVFSVAAIQTEDLAVRRGDGFELVGRAPLAEPRGCSLMAGESQIKNHKS